MNLVISPSGNVQRIGLRFSSRSYDDVERAMKAKFGSPDLQQTVPVTNAFGARYDNVESKWVGQGVYVTMRRFAGASDTSAVMFQSDEDIEMDRAFGEERSGDL